MWSLLACAALAACTSDVCALEPIDELCVGKTSDCPQTWEAAQDGASWSCDAGDISFWRCSDVEYAQTTYVDTGLRFYYDVETGRSTGVDAWHTGTHACHDRICDTPYEVDLVPSGSDCERPCNVLTQQGCASGARCTWLHDVETPTPLGHIGCAPDGLVPVGGACTYGSDGPDGYDNCTQGNVCDLGICKQICAEIGRGPHCPSSFRCTTHRDLFEGNIVAGVCDAL